MPIKVLSSLPDCISVPAFWTRASVLSNSCILEGKRYCWNREHTEKPQGVTMTEEVKYHGPRSNWPISLPLMPDKNPEVKVVSLNKSIWKYPEGEISAGALKKKKCLLKKHCERPISASGSPTRENGERGSCGSVIDRNMMDGPWMETSPAWELECTVDVLRDYLKTAEFTSVLLLQQEEQWVPVPEHTFQLCLSLADCFVDLGRRPTMWFCQ